MRLYNKNLKTNSRNLRSNLTDSEQLLWSRIRRKQILAVQFYRQKPLGYYIVDFYAPAVKLVIEVDGGQHFEEEGIRRDKMRDAYLASQKLKVLRFDNLEVLRSLDAVLEVIFNEVSSYKNKPGF